MESSHTQDPFCTLHPRTTHAYLSSPISRKQPQTKIGIEIANMASATCTSLSIFLVTPGFIVAASKSEWQFCFFSVFLEARKRVAKNRRPLTHLEILAPLFFFRRKPRISPMHTAQQLAAGHSVERRHGKRNSQVQIKGTSF